MLVSLSDKDDLGEGVYEETRRLSTALKFAEELSPKMIELEKYDHAGTIVDWAIKTINNPPSYIGDNLKISKELKDNFAHFKSVIEKALLDNLAL
jgi:hypothetical protein